MRARFVHFTDPYSVEIGEEALPDLDAGEVLLRTDLSAISQGTEKLVYRGEIPEDLSLDTSIAALEKAAAYPFKYGYSAVARVVQTGSGVHPSLDGRRVFAFHPHQDFFSLPAAQIIPLPDDLPVGDAVFLPNVETALSLVMDGAPLVGERVAVIGQGIVGLLTTTILARFPLDALVAIDRYALRRSASTDAGVHAAFDPDEVPLDLQQTFDLVFEVSGSPEALDTALRLVGEEGRIVVGSWYGTRRAEPDLGGHFHRGRLTLLSSQVSRLAPKLTGRWTKTRRMAFAVRLAKELQPSRFITHRFHLRDASRAYELIDKRPEESIQVVLEYN